jgi:hypothetical protein
MEEYFGGLLTGMVDDVGDEVVSVKACCFLFDVFMDSKIGRGVGSSDVVLKLCEFNGLVGANVSCGFSSEILVDVVDADITRQIFNFFLLCVDDFGVDVSVRSFNKAVSLYILISRRLL